jgi:hypothetical protein
MAEWSKAPDSKSGLGQPNGGSNPSLSATFQPIDALALVRNSRNGSPQFPALRLRPERLYGRAGRCRLCSAECARVRAGLYCASLMSDPHFGRRSRIWKSVTSASLHASRIACASLAGSSPDRVRPGPPSTSLAPGRSAPIDALERGPAGRRSRAGASCGLGPSPALGMARSCSKKGGAVCAAPHRPHTA